MDVRAAIVAEARTWLKTPYHHRAMVKGAGVDCAMILVAVYSAVGLIEKFDTGEYPIDWALHRQEERYLGFLQKYGREVSTPGIGDVTVWKIGRVFSHGGIVVGTDRVIHAHRKDGEVCECVPSGCYLKDLASRHFSIIGVC